MMKEFALKDMIITLDALHCQTKTLKAIKDSGNEYVIQVKENQKNS
jgi:predicted transposase YbfD/YdcC